VREINWRIALFEMLIVVVGILIAFRVDEWKDTRAEEREVSASLARLADDFVGNRLLCETLSTEVRVNHDAVWHVYTSLQEGHVIGGDSEKFERGLVNADFIPQIPISTLGYREMIATGLLRSLKDVDLAVELGLLETELENSRVQIPYYRVGPAALASELRDVVDFQYTDSPDQPGVRFDFADLVGNRRIRNLYFETVDSHGDVAFHLTRICDLVDRISVRLAHYQARPDEPPEPLTTPRRDR
jgi:hypothetical protein